MCIYNYRIVTKSQEFWCLSPYWAHTVLSTLRTEVLDEEEKLIDEVLTEYAVKLFTAKNYVTHLKK